jgi:hypothetical protein
MPMKFRISSEYGVLEEIRGGRVHRGIDLAMPRGTELHSIADGTIEKVINNKLMGNGVYVRTESGDVHVYGHLDKVSVHPGDHVNAGELIGLSGNTGHSTGPHLHFALLHDGHVADPTSLVNAVQHYSGDIAGPSFLGIKGPALMIAERVPHSIGEAVKDQVAHSMAAHVLDWLQAAATVLYELSYGAGLIGCAALIILGTVGLKNGYRWAGLTFTSVALIRYLLGGVAK